MSAKQFNPPYGITYASRVEARKLHTNMSTIKKIIIAIVLVVVTATAVSSYNDYVQFEQIRANHMVGECEMTKDGYKMCSSVEIIYEGPAR